jgi:hypothetical protein
VTPQGSAPSPPSKPAEGAPGSTGAEAVAAPPAEGETCLAFLVLPIDTAKGPPFTPSGEGTLMAFGAQAPGEGPPPHGPPPPPYNDPRFSAPSVGTQPLLWPYEQYLRPNTGCYSQPSYPHYFPGYYPQLPEPGYYYPPPPPQDCDYYGYNDSSTHGVVPLPPPPVRSSEVP